MLRSNAEQLLISDFARLRSEHPECLLGLVDHVQLSLQKKGKSKHTEASLAGQCYRSIKNSSSFMFLVLTCLPLQMCTCTSRHQPARPCTRPGSRPASCSRELFFSTTAQLIPEQQEKLCTRPTSFTNSFSAVT